MPLLADDIDQAILRHRTGVLVIRTAPGARVAVEQMRHEFWFGATLPNGIFSGRARPEDVANFKRVFKEYFNAGVVENALKWHQIEMERGRLDFTILDNILEWADQEGIPVRGHCIYWGIPHRVQDWLKALDDRQLLLALRRHGQMIAGRYRGRFAEYDLNNEMIHGNYYEERLGPEITKQMAQWIKEVDPGAKLFLNDYDILTGNRLADYVRHIQGLLAQGVLIDGIGVQGHLHGDSFDPVMLRRALDELAQFKLPIRVTEFNFPGQRSKYYQQPENRKLALTPEEELVKAEAIRQYYRIFFSHPAVTGILMWGFWEGANWIPQSSLFKRDWTPTPAAEAYKNLVYKEWWTRWQGTAGKDGLAVVRCFFGTHKVTVGGREYVVELKRSEGSKLVELP